MHFPQTYVYSRNIGVNAQMLMCLISDGAVERLFLSLTVKTNAVKKAKVILSETSIKGLFIVLLKVW